MDVVDYREVRLAAIVLRGARLISNEEYNRIRKQIWLQMYGRERLSDYPDPLED